MKMECGLSGDNYNSSLSVPLLYQFAASATVTAAADSYDCLEVVACTSSGCCPEIKVVIASSIAEILN